MFVHERHDAILRALHERLSVKAADLATEIGVSFETIRRDLERLEREGFLRRVHGGATLPASDYGVELPFTVRSVKQVERKKAVARKALEFLEEGQSIFLDVSTTNTEFAKALLTRFERLTVLTNSFPIAELLMEKPAFTIIFIGGTARNSERCIVGAAAEAFVSQFRADVFFMSVSGISLTEGYTDYGMGEIELKKKMLERSARAIVLADSSKFDVVSLSFVCGLDAVDMIVTDPDLDPEAARRYADRGIRIAF